MSYRILSSVGNNGKNARNDILTIQKLINQNISKLIPLKLLDVNGQMSNQLIFAITEFQKRVVKLKNPDGRVDPHGNTIKYLGGAPTQTGNLVVDDKLAPWMPTAKAEIGVHEIAGTGTGKSNKRIEEFLRTTTISKSYIDSQGDEIAWCSAFVNWVLIQNNIRGTNNALAKSWLSWQEGVLLSEPRYGSIVVIKKNQSGADPKTGSNTGYHVGFLVNVTSGRANILGGNQGDSVKYSNFNLGSYKIQGYLWPKSHCSISQH